jgi:ribonuclease HI
LVIPAWKIHLNFSLTEDISIFTAELISILKAIETINHNPPSDAIIFTDSLSSIKVLRMRHVAQRPDIVEEILITTTDLRSRGCRVGLVWILAHVNITGNDLADKQAIARRSGTNNIEVSLSTAEIQSVTRKVIDREWKSDWNN